MSSMHLSYITITLKEFLEAAARLGWKQAVENEGEPYITDGRNLVFVSETMCSDGLPHVSLWRGGGSDYRSLESICAFCSEGSSDFGRLYFDAEDRASWIAEGDGDPWGWLSDEELYGDGEDAEGAA